MASSPQAQDGYTKALAWVRSRWARVRHYASLIAPGWLSASVSVLMSVAMLHPQTVDALAALAEERGFLSQRNLALFFSLLCFSLSVWYITRAMMYVRYDDEADGSDVTLHHRQVVTWLPRILGALPIATVAFAFLRSGKFAFVVVYVAIAIGFLVLLDRRRKWLEAKAAKAGTEEARQGYALDALSPSLPRTTRRIVAATLLAAFVGLIVVIAAPVSVPSAVGPLGVIFLAGAGWVIVGSSLLVYPSRRFKLPSLFVTLLFLAVIFGIWNDNHGIEPIAESYEEVEQRPDLDEQFEAWLNHRPATHAEGGNSTPYPVFVVTAEGGGIRAAYWTAAVLNAITAHAPEFPCHVFAMSGVSGGSLGAAAYAARLADTYFLSDDQDRLCKWPSVLRIEDKAPPIEITDSNYVRIEEFAPTLTVELEALGQDFLSPVLAGMLFPDLVQRMLPVPLLPDRGSYLERSWEAAWPRAWKAQKGNAIAREFADRGRTSNEDNRFRQSFLELWHKDLSVLTPSLLLNATRVETGERVIVSNLRLEGEEGHGAAGGLPFGFAIDLLDRMGGSVKLSQAIHFSARFTYLSPAARIEDRTTGRAARIVDGGYFENSGAVTASELVDALQKKCAEKENWSCRVHVLIISNDVGNPNAWQEELGGRLPVDPDGSCDCDGGGRDCYEKPTERPHDVDSTPNTATFFTETLSPVRALFATRSARGYLAEEQLYSGMACRAYRAQLKQIGTRDIPLGWILSDTLQTEIRCQAMKSITTHVVAEHVSQYWGLSVENVLDLQECSDLGRASIR